MNERLAPLCKLVFNFRLIVVAVTVFSIGYENGNKSPLLVALMLATAASFLPLRYWDRFSPMLLRHPAFLAGDLVLTMLILSVIGPESPFFYFTLGTSLLSGVLYGAPGAAVFSVMLLATYGLGLAPRAQVRDGIEGFQLLVGYPVLYPLTAAAGAAVRRLIEAQKSAEEALATSARSAAIERERARIAREMHDSLAKTIHGIGLQAAALKKWIKGDPARAERDAAVISEAARRAASEARGLIRDLRLDIPESSLCDSVAAFAGQWSEESGVAVALDLDDVDCSCPESRWELLNILKEALYNVERHAVAEKVRVTLIQQNGAIRLEVADDGTGFDLSGLPALQRAGHFGLIGMAERAERIGGHLDVRSVPAQGAVISVMVPPTEGEERR
jgi:signal transduction histidine kinase